MKTHFTRKFQLLFACLLSLAAANAQQTPYVGFYRQNWSLVNPAATDPWSFLEATGWNRSTLFMASYRKQGVASELDGAPYTGAFSFEITPDVNKNVFNNSRHYKGGFTILKDQADAISTLGVYATGSYWWPMGEGYFHIGGSAGLIQYGVDRNQLRNYDPNDPIIEAAGKEWQPDFGIGVMFRNAEQYIGLSMPQTLTEVYSKNRRTHVYLNAGRIFETESGMKIEPSMWLRWTPGLTYQAIGNIPLSGDLNARMIFPLDAEGKEKRRTLWFGAGTGTGFNLNIEAGIELFSQKGPRTHNHDIHQTRIGIVGGIPMSKRRSPLGSSFELTLAHAFN